MYSDNLFTTLWFTQMIYNVKKWTPSVMLLDGTSISVSFVIDVIYNFYCCILPDDLPITNILNTMWWYQYIEYNATRCTKKRVTIIDWLSEISTLLNIGSHQNVQILVKVGTANLIWNVKNEKSKVSLLIKYWNNIETYCVAWLNKLIIVFMK